MGSYPPSFQWLARLITILALKGGALLYVQPELAKDLPGEAHHGQVANPKT